MAEESLDELRGKLESVTLRAQIAAVESALRMADTSARYVPRPIQEAWGDTVDRTEYLRDGNGLSYFGELAGGRRLSQASDRRDGDNVPFWQTETELAYIRGVARVLATVDEVAIGALDNLTNYAIGQGFAYKVVPRDETSIDAAQLATRVQAFVDRFLDANDFACEGEREFFQSSRRDGEVCLALEHRGGALVEIVPVDPGAVTEPDSPHMLSAYGRLPDVPLSWKYGIATRENRTHRPLAYFVEWASGNGQDWDLYGAESFEHVRLNVDRAVKRGLSDYYAVYRNLERAGKLLGNTMEGASVQAAIAYIREHAAGATVDTITDLVQSRADIRRTDPATGKTRNIAKVKPGTVVDVTSGMKYHAGPMGSPNGPAFVEIVQAGLRMTGIRWTMPEYMISGDASNANFSSTLVSESPFVKATESRQQVYVRAYRRLVWKAVCMVATKTTLFGANVTPRVLDELLELQVDAPEAAVRNRLEEHTIRKEEHAAGILSLQTWATEANRDLAAEQRLGAKPAPPPPAPTVFGGVGQPTPAQQQPPTPGQAPPQPAPNPMAAQESARRQIVADVIQQVWASYP